MRRQHVAVATFIGGSLLAGGALGVAAFGPHFALAHSSASQSRGATFVADQDPADGGAKHSGRSKRNCPHGEGDGDSSGTTAPGVAPQSY